ncbi:MAG: hypothetical protein QM728_14670 [Gordonia sp. (in: high G+C Gram-positive bacteria)]|uniref:hypothetical protein n=1 Tax=Gordonia sp. (in: high G+C Gram-positive bacteria) TaxID=84139 RepID=UPI0039E31ABF
MRRALLVSATAIGVLAAGLVSGCSPGPAPTATISAGEAATAAGFSAVTVRRAGQLGDGTNWTVMLPQVRGGDAGVRTSFNGQLDALLTTLTGAPSGNGQTMSDGSLGSAERSRAVIGERTLAGVVIVLSGAKGAAHPNTRVETVVVDNQTGEAITEPFDDPDGAAEAIAELAAANDPTGRLKQGGVSFGTFRAWLPLPEGMHLYVSVPHAAGDFVPVTVPWHKVSGLLKPDVREVLVG